MPSTATDASITSTSASGSDSRTPPAAVFPPRPGSSGPVFFAPTDEDDPMTRFFHLRSLAIVALLCCCGALAGCARNEAATQAVDPATTAEAVASPALIPAPASMVQAEGSCRFDANTRVHAEGAIARRVADSFADMLEAGAGARPALAGDGDAGAGDIRFVIDPAASPDAAEGYVLEVAGDGIRVAASDERGLFYGAVTLWQLLSSARGEAVRIPALRIEDAPRFDWRGVMLDSARHVKSGDQIGQLLDAMARHKLNVLH